MALKLVELSSLLLVMITDHSPLPGALYPTVARIPPPCQPPLIALEPGGQFTDDDPTAPSSGKGLRKMVGPLATVMVEKEPLGPTGPAGPVDPFGPCGPLIPCGPRAPLGPRRTRLMLALGEACMDWTRALSRCSSWL